MAKNPSRVELTLHYPGHLLDPEDLLSFIESPVFTRAWKRCGLTDDDLFELQAGIMANPDTMNEKPLNFDSPDLNKAPIMYEKKPVEMRDNSVENEIIEALTGFTDAMEKSEVCERFTCRQIKLNLKPTQYSPALVRRTRRMLGLSQVLFARFLGISPKTVRSWEQGINTPTPMACRFMDEIRQNREYWANRLRDLQTVTDSL
ncbi:MAG: helix-turn-helix domain-containing protein [Dehalococcoidia bacterium]|nr:helix-turn-helix domain-containing protein [Dehalococcoidia bacterium]